MLSPDSISNESSALPATDELPVANAETAEKAGDASSAPAATRSRAKKFLSYYRPYLGLFFTDMACALVVAAITLLLPLCARYITKNVLDSIRIHDWDATETYIFPADESGEVVDWGELSGSRKGTLDHAVALRDAGYEVA